MYIIKYYNKYIVCEMVSKNESVYKNINKNNNINIYLII